MQRSPLNKPLKLLMSKLLLHLDADTSIKALHQALVSRGHDVTRTPTDWMPLDASDEVQLLGATAQGRCIFTFIATASAVRTPSAEHTPSHRGDTQTGQVACESDF